MTCRHQPPGDGELLWAHDENFPLGGYHRVELNEPVLVEPGDRIGVVATVTLPDGSTEISQNSDVSEAMAETMTPERDACIRAGWRNEGIAWYGL